MALPTVADLKAYLRVETAADDALLARILASATAAVEALVERPILAVARTFTDVREVYNPETGASVLHLPLYPASVVTSVVDDDGATVPGADYALDVRTGRVLATDGVAWNTGPYAVTATVGLTAHPDYLTLIEPRLSAGILLAAADLYQNRNPRASSESAAGAGVGLTADADARVRAVLGDLVPARGRVLV